MTGTTACSVRYAKWTVQLNLSTTSQIQIMMLCLDFQIELVHEDDDIMIKHWSGRLNNSSEYICMLTDFVTQQVQ